MGPIITIVKNAYDIIKDHDRWAQGYFQKDKDGKNCAWEDGYSFCALGALCFVANKDNDQLNDNFYHKALCIVQRHSEQMFQGNNIQTVNDSTPCAIAYENVLRIFESVIEKFKDREPTEEELVQGINMKSLLK